MFFIIPTLTFYGSHIVLIAAAVIPAVVLLIFIYRSDRLESEPKEEILHLILLGIISTSIAVVFERVGSFVLNLFFKNHSSVIYRILLYFGIVGISEELSKFVVMDRQVWSSPHFNCKFDGIVYATTVSLGFALWENIDYVLMYGFRTALLRAVTAVPGHACFGVFMGVWYGLAKRCAVRGDTQTCIVCRRLCIFMPAFIHGCYDYIVSQPGVKTTPVFIIFVLAMFAISYFVVKRLSSTDEYL